MCKESKEMDEQAHILVANIDKDFFFQTRGILREDASEMGHSNKCFK